MLYFWYIFFGLAPSIVWLLIFLMQDRYPESKKMILRIFLCGMLAAIVVILISEPIRYFLETMIDPLIELKISTKTFLPSVVLLAIIIAPILEESIKYLVVRLRVIGHLEFDEPIDAMIYMIVAALGLAAVENLLYSLPALWGQWGDLNNLNLLWFAITRFVGATFLHALCSALVGYYLALSFFNLKNRFKLIRKGLLTAVILHGLFNLFTINIEGSLGELNGQLIIENHQLLMISIGAIIALLVGLAIFVIYGLKKVKQLKSVCEM